MNDHCIFRAALLIRPTIAVESAKTSRYKTFLMEIFPSVFCQDIPLENVFKRLVNVGSRHNR